MSEEQQRMEFRVGSEDIPSCPRCGSTQVREEGIVIGIDHIGNSKWTTHAGDIRFCRDLSHPTMCLEDNCEWGGVTGDLYRHPSDHRLSAKEIHTQEYTVKATSRQAAKEKLDNRDQWGEDIYDHGETRDTLETMEEPALDLEFPEPEQLKRYFARIVLETNMVAKAQEQPEWKDADAVVILRTLSELVLHGNDEIDKLTKEREEIFETVNEQTDAIEFVRWAVGESIPTVIRKMAATITLGQQRIKILETELEARS